MAYYLDIFSPETYEAFSKTDKSTTGFRIRQLKTAERINRGDKFLCYITKLSRWIGVLEIQSECYIDEDTQIFYSEDDPFVVRFMVSPIAWLDKEKAVPIREDHIWSRLSFTKEHEKHTSSWTGKFRSSLTHIDDDDGEFLEKIIVEQSQNGILYEVDDREYRKLIAPRVRRTDKVVSVSIPEDVEEEVESGAEPTVRESIKYQALLAEVGDQMGFSIWIPRNDRSRVIQEWEQGEEKLLDQLPLNYDEATIRTIEQIDVIWLKKRAIVRAFEVEHSTAVYSGILRMADLLALQPNMDIKLHIVAPTDRKEKVFQELQRPVFSLLDKGPLYEICTYLSYDSLDALAHERHLAHLSDSVIEEYQEEVE